AHNGWRTGAPARSRHSTIDRLSRGRSHQQDRWGLKLVRLSAGVGCSLERRATMWQPGSRGCTILQRRVCIELTGLHTETVLCKAVAEGAIVDPQESGRALLHTAGLSERA